MCIFVLFQSGSMEPVEKVSNMQVKQVLVKVFLKICLCMVLEKKKQLWRRKHCRQESGKNVPTNLADRLSLYLLY